MGVGLALDFIARASGPNARRLGPLHILLQGIINRGRWRMPKVCVNKMLHNRPPIRIGKHATNNDVVVSIGLQAYEDLAPGQITVIGPGNLLFHFETTFAIGAGPGWDMGRWCRFRIGMSILRRSKCQGSPFDWQGWWYILGMIDAVMENSSRPGSRIQNEIRRRQGWHQ